MTGRAQALDDTAWQVLAAAAVLGGRFDCRLLAAMVELLEEVVVGDLQDPDAHGLEGFQRREGRSSSWR